MQNDIQDYAHTGTQVSSQEALLQKTYGLLALSFLPAAAGAVVSMLFNPLMMVGNRWLALGIMLVFFYGMCFAIAKNRYSQTGVVLLMIFTFGMGIFLGPLLQYSTMFSNGSQLVAVAAMMTAGVFFTMAALARKLNINTHALGKFLGMGVVVIMIGVVANIFLQLPVLSLTLAGAFVIFSSLMMMWQIRMVIEGGEDSYISAALTIFISIYNLFSSLLQLLLSFAGED